VISPPLSVAEKVTILIPFDRARFGDKPMALSTVVLSISHSNVVMVPSLPDTFAMTLANSPAAPSESATTTRLPPLSVTTTGV